MTERKIISSWKDIAKYLGLEVRTAQRWEKDLQLPVFRIKKYNKTFVFAYCDELDKWIEENATRELGIKRQFLKDKHLILGVVSVVLIALIIFFFSTVFPGWRHTIPSEFKIRGSDLLIYDENGKQIWSYNTRLDLDPARYQHNKYMQSSGKSAQHINVFFKDIDKDKNLNVIFAVQTIDNSNERVLCLDKKGNPMWSFAAGKGIQYGNQLISSDFDINRIRVEDVNNDGFFEIIVVASHKIYFPCRVSVLNNKGSVIGEYWNSGHLSCIEFLDLDIDGTEEIILGGLNNNYQKPCLVVLDPRNIAGSSPQEMGTRYYSEELGPGTEKYYLLIPRNEVGKLLGIYEFIPAVDLYKNKRIQISTSLSRVFYEFDYRLKPTYIHLGDEFNFKFKNLEREGKISIPLSTVKANILKSKILYWNGKAWTDKPTISDLWKK